MNKHLLAALLVATAAFSANQAMAQVKGPVLQGTQLNGLPVPGPILHGTQVDGLLASGPVVKLIQSHATGTAPNWSALPVSQMTVRLASEI